MNSSTTDTQLVALYKLAVTAIGAFKEKSTKWKNLTPPIIIFCVLAMIAVMGTLINYIVTSRIGPLMILIAVLIPILCFGLAQSTRTISKLKSEFNEYNDAMAKFIKIFSAIDVDVSDDTLWALAQVLAGAYVYNSDDIMTDAETIQNFAKNTTLATLIEYFDNELKDAVHLACAMKASLEAYNDMVQEGYDVDEILSTLDDDEDTSDMDAFYQLGNSLFDALQEIKKETTPTTNTQPSSPVPTIEPIDNSVKLTSTLNPDFAVKSTDESIEEQPTHIIPMSEEEDLSIVV